MLCVEVWVNGEKLCTAGAREFERLFVHLTWHNPAENGTNAAPNLKVYGVTASGPQESMYWTHRSLGKGDEVRLKLIDADTFDKPRKSEPQAEPTSVSAPSQPGVKVSLNGNTLSAAGLEDFGTLFVQFAHHNLPERRKVSVPNPFLEVHGHLEKEPYNYLTWVAQGVGIGDEMAFQLVEAQPYDQPEKKELLTPELIDQPLIQEFVALVEGAKQSEPAAE